MYIMHFIEDTSDGSTCAVEVSGNSRNDCVMTYLTSPVLNGTRPISISTLRGGCILAEYNNEYVVLTSDGDDRIYAKWLSKK